MDYGARNRLSRLAYVARRAVIASPRGAAGCVVRVSLGRRGGDTVTPGVARQSFGCDRALTPNKSHPCVNLDPIART